MCGIVGIIGQDRVTQRLVDGLKRLEYRGYDSAGVAVLTGETTQRRRAAGKLVNLQAVLERDPIDGPVGIAHTRWATHGAPTEDNAHPHIVGPVAIIHNGIIENYAEIKADLSHRTFRSDTDTEVAAHLIAEKIEQGLSPREAFGAAVKEFRGAYAIAVIINGNPDEIYCARHGAPLAIGRGEGENYLGSDAMALAALTDRLIYLDDGDWAVLTRNNIEIFDETNARAQREETVVTGAEQVAEKGQYPHYMLKEIYEQSETLALTLAHYLDLGTMRVEMPEGLDMAKVKRIMIVACGTAFYAGMVAKYLFENIAGVAVEIDVASEFRYRRPVLDEGTLFVAVSQSGETADTLAAMRYASDAGLKTLALVNVMTSTMAREADIATPIKAGPEIGVASTKAFTSQVCALAAMVIGTAQQRGKISGHISSDMCRELVMLPGLITDALQLDPEIAEIARSLPPAKSAFFLGRGSMVPIALEGALKLKEISYIHAEGYAAGELKHGPIALIEDGTPVIVVCPMDELFEKTISNVQEVAARGARIIIFTDPKGEKEARAQSDSVVILPEGGALTAPIVQAIGMQLLAYHTAVALGTDVDQPRNLAKSVTVE